MRWATGRASEIGSTGIAHHPRWAPTQLIHVRRSARASYTWTCCSQKCAVKRRKAAASVGHFNSVGAPDHVLDRQRSTRQYPFGRPRSGETAGAQERRAARRQRDPAQGSALFAQRLSSSAAGSGDHVHRHAYCRVRGRVGLQAMTDRLIDALRNTSAGRPIRLCGRRAFSVMPSFPARSAIQTCGQG